MSIRMLMVLFVRLWMQMLESKNQNDDVDDAFVDD